MEYLRTRRRMKRDRPNKKWREDEVKMVLNYLQRCPQIEAPTAQIYYRKLIEVTGIDSSWDLLRWKVRHLRISYKKASEWLKTKGAELLESESEAASVEVKLLRKCPHYKQLNEIFGRTYNGEENSVLTIDSDDNTTMDEKCLNFQYDDIQESSLEINDTQTQDEQLNKNQIEEIEELPIDVPCDVEGVENAASPLKRTRQYPPKSASAYLAAYQTERTALFQMKFEWEKEKHKKEMELNERKLKLEEEKTKAELEFKGKELELKRLAIEKDAELRMLEMDKDERLKRYEIELKFKKEYE